MTSATIIRTVDYLLIGGGLASATAAKAIRQRDPRGSILMVTDELELPYHRPPLSKEYLRGEIGAEGVYGKGGVYVHRRPWYEEQRIEVLRGVEARSLDYTRSAGAPRRWARLPVSHAAPRHRGTRAAAERSRHGSARRACSAHAR